MLKYCLYTCTVRNRRENHAKVLYESKFGNDNIQNLSIQMHDDLSERTKDYFNIPMVISATFLDPRYRNFHFIKDDKERQTLIN
jgi:hypothetical protein